MQVPAAGWIKHFVLKDDGFYRAMDWTKRAAEYLENKEYRYISPVINIRKEDRKVMELHSDALTNTPAIDTMEAIANSDKPGLDEVSSEESEDGSGSTLAALAKLLQLDPLHNYGGYLQSRFRPAEGARFYAAESRRVPV